MRDWLTWVTGIGGADLAGRRKPRDPPAQLTALLRFHEIDGVLDVGANEGQYVSMLRRFGYTGQILSFEPLPGPHAALGERARDDEFWDLAPRMALGDHDGEIGIEVSAESDMSSILPQNALLQRLSPSSAVTERLTVPLRRLDGLAVDIGQRLHLKVDVQGFEPQVLEGAAGLMERLCSIQLEMALLPIYDGERDWRSTVDAMGKSGFDLHLVLPGYFERKIARQLQIDGIFVRRGA